MPQTKGKPVWLCRDDSGRYAVFTEGGMKKNARSGNWFGRSFAGSWSDKECEALFGHHPLSPGECARVVMSVEVVEE